MRVFQFIRRFVYFFPPNSLFQLGINSNTPSIKNWLFVYLSAVFSHISYFPIKPNRDCNPNGKATEITIDDSKHFIESKNLKQLKF